MANIRLLFLVVALLCFLFAATSATTADPPAVTNLLFSGEHLGPGQYLAYGETYGLLMKEDCNLVLFEYKVAIWSTRTGGQGRNCYATVQEDGNFVVYTPEGRGLWAANNVAKPRGRHVLVLQKDRNLVVYGPVSWSSGTQSHTSSQVEGMEATDDVVTAHHNTLPSYSQVIDRV
ncbi:hypothetical protein H6P81_018015 [Aristolochia fimbriata]|uniref:Bulb-type lectin domain-containing protein n=1 Tax=Aristolochia fimbriata TaxID=158543 RepID=A0AAV7E196_ARIFI|nr:hypothetical protein H6P81_018015 [Aristolochia fimbriata]